MLMRKIKFKILILLIFALSTSQYSLDIFADTPSQNTPVTENESTILDGEIGEWDPTLNDNPNFNQDGLEIEGHKPQDGEYYTISVTVPLNMEFYVIQHQNLTEGNLFSPIYTIKNNGSKKISVNLSSFERQNNIASSNDTTPLYVEQINPTDNKTQMELRMCAIEDLNDGRINKEIDLTKLSTLSPQDKELYVLNSNQEKGIKFAADDWELPQFASNKENAMSNFTSSFVFSIKN